jgi:hypothetical protein
LTSRTVAVPPQVTQGAVFLNTRLQTRARAATASAAPAPVPTVPLMAPAKAASKGKGTNKGKGKGKGTGKGKGKASASSKQQPMQQASTTSGISLEALVALVEDATTAQRIEAARDDALLAVYQDLSDIGSQLHGMAMPAVDQVTMTSMLCTAASGPQEDVLSWLAADKHPTASSCNDSEFFAMCTAFGLLDC